MSSTAYIALGSNLGDRAVSINGALAALNQPPHIKVERVSTIYETDPVGGPQGQGRYLNAAAALRTDLLPKDLLARLLKVEQDLGRVRYERDGPRTIDLDLLLFGDLIHEGPGLIIPHPRMHERLFVLQPLNEIGSDIVHPATGRTVSQLLASLQNSQATRNEITSSQPPIRVLSPVPIGQISRASRDLSAMNAVVTGSTSGIGKAIALELAAAGANILIHGRKLDDGQAVAAQCKQCGVATHVIMADLLDVKQRENLVERAWTEFAGVDIWINNAGADTLTGNAAHWPFERKMEELFSVDVFSTIFLSRKVGRLMKERGRGVIVNMGWDQAETGMEGDSGQLFGASKAAVMAFTKSLSLSLAPEVRVNCLAPGWIKTAWGDHASSAWQNRVRQETPLSRWGTPGDVAAAARWLASPASSFITGQIIRINGGVVR